MFENPSRSHAPPLSFGYGRSYVLSSGHKSSKESLRLCVVNNDMTAIYVEGTASCISVAKHLGFFLSLWVWSFCGSMFIINFYGSELLMGNHKYISNISSISDL